MRWMIVVLLLSLVLVSACTAPVDSGSDQEIDNAVTPKTPKTSFCLEERWIFSFKTTDSKDFG